MSRDPLITTIIPTYRRPRLLKRAVLSVLDQSVTDFVVEIQDNASGDETERIVADLMRADSRVRYHRHPENLGAIRNIINGMERVRTPYFHVLCDDDLLMPGFFETSLRIHREAGDRLAFVSTNVVVFDENGDLSAPFPHPETWCRLDAPLGMLRCLRTGVSLPGVMYRTQAIRDVGMPRLEWWNWTESGWHALAGIRFPIAFTPEPGAIMCDHSAGGSKQMDSIEFRVSWFRMMADMRRAASQSPVSEALLRQQLRAHQYAMFVMTCLRIAGADDSAGYDELAELGRRSGLSSVIVSAGAGAGRMLRGLRLGGLLNRAADRLVALRSRDPKHPATPGRAQREEFASASRVLMRLNGKAGVVPMSTT
jgi:hypothetical protein